MTFLSAAAAPSALKAMDAASQAIASNVRNRSAVSICFSPQCSPEYQLGGLFSIYTIIGLTGKSSKFLNAASPQVATLWQRVLCRCSEVWNRVFRRPLEAIPHNRQVAQKRSGHPKRIGITRLNACVVYAENRESRPGGIDREVRFGSCVTSIAGPTGSAIRN